jgi:hypothetical protein
MKDADAHTQAQTVADAGAWFFNVATSVLIVFVNKVLMDSKTGYKFTFGKCLWPCEPCMQLVGPCLPCSVLPLLQPPHYAPCIFSQQQPFSR